MVSIKFGGTATGVKNITKVDKKIKQKGVK